MSLKNQLNYDCVILTFVMHNDPLHFCRKISGNIFFELKKKKLFIPGCLQRSRDGRTIIRYNNTLESVSEIFRDRLPTTTKAFFENCRLTREKEFYYTCFITRQ